MDKRPWLIAPALVTGALALAACGVSVASGGENAATHPASGIFTANTVGGGNMSVNSTPPVPYRAPDNTAPAVLPAGQKAAVRAVEGAVDTAIAKYASTGCWQDSHAGSNYGAYDQEFWYQGDCGETVASVTVELYPSVAAAKAHERHAVSAPLLGRYLDGSVLVDVWSIAPSAVGTAVSQVKGLTAVPGYGSY